MCTNGVKSLSPVRDHEGGDVVALESHLQGVNGHLDVCGVLPARPHPLRDFDELDMMVGKPLTVIAEVGPIRIGLAGNHPAPLSQGVGNGFEVELKSTEVVPRPDRQVLVVEEKRDPFFFSSHAVSVAATSPRRVNSSSLSNEGSEDLCAIRPPPGAFSPSGKASRRSSGTVIGTTWWGP